MVWLPETSSYQRIHAVLDGLVSAARKKEKMDEHLKLVGLIEADRHLLVGAKALAVYIEQRFTKDTDYVVGHRTYQKVRKWLKKEDVVHDDSGETIRAEVLGLDIIDASHNPVLTEILKRESGIPSPEALAATKYIAIVSGTRERRKVYQDIADLVGLVTLDGFDVGKLLGYLVDRYEEQRTRVQALIDKIQRGESPIVI